LIPGDEYKPEFIFPADHYNVNLERKLESLSKEDYISMKSLIFDQKTQVYVNASEGLKIYNIIIEVMHENAKAFQ
jgi:hypothetical protein